MYQSRSVAVVIPAYNVANQIRFVIKGIPEFVDYIIAVNDASTDATAEVVATIADLRLTLLHHATNQGVGGAMVSGLRCALEQGADVIVKMDGDGQMDPEFLPHLLDAIITEGYGYSKGNRFLCEDQLSSMPLVRRVGTFVLTFLSKLASGYWHVFDPVNGYLAIDAAVLRRFPIENLSRRYFFETDMLIKLNILKTRIKDVPIPPRYGDERSSMRLGTVLVTFPLYLFRGFWYRLYRRHVLREFSPIAVFWILGVLFLTWGTSFGLWTWIRSTLSGHVASTGTVMLSVLPFILGFQLVLQAITLEIQESPR